MNRSVRTYLRYLPYFLAFLLLIACGDSPKRTLRGTITDAYTNGPVDGAQVIVGNRPGIATNTGGAWQTQEWKPSDQIVIMASGYQSTTLPLGERPDINKSQTLTVTLDVALRPDTLSGVISDVYTGQPLPGAVVEVVGSTPVISATTDATGKYLLEGVPEALQIVVRAEGVEEQRADVRRSTEQHMAMRPNVLTGVVRDTADRPVAGVSVQMGDAVATTDEQGEYRLLNVPPQGELIFTREGYDEVSRAFTETTRLDPITLRPNVVAGVVTDLQSGAVLSDTFVMVSSTMTGTAVSSTRTDKDGRFELKNVPEGAYLKALLPGYKRAETKIPAGGLQDGLKLEPIEVKAVYVKSVVAASKENVQEYFDLIDRTELNGIVLDLKSDNLEDLGQIHYASEIPLVKELGTSRDVMDIRWILAEAKKRNIYMIARIHVFSHDNELVKVRPDWYVQKDGEPWYADFGVAWLDAYNEEVWDYNIALAQEAAQLGFDEINLDYIRFPSDGDLTGTIFKGPRDWRNNPDDMYNTIGRFLERAQKAINDAGAYVGGDVFGYAAWAPQPNIGQNLQVMGRYLDYVYPMVYPSHFLFGELGFENPGEHPYEIVAKSMELVKDQLNGPAARARVRPWLQDFTLIWVPDQYIVRYGAKEVRAQIDAAEAYDTNGWGLWDSDNDYTEGALKPQE